MALEGLRAVHWLMVPQQLDQKARLKEVPTGQHPFPTHTGLLWVKYGLSPVKPAWTFNSHYEIWRWD